MTTHNINLLMQPRVHGSKPPSLDGYEISFASCELTYVHSTAVFSLFLADTWLSVVVHIGLLIFGWMKRFDIDLSLSFNDGLLLRARVERKGIALSLSVSSLSARTNSIRCILWPFICRRASGEGFPHVPSHEISSSHIYTMWCT